MNNLETHVRSINEKLQQLLKKYVSIKKENETLTGKLNQLKQKDEDSANSIAELKQKVNILQVASGNMSENDQKEFEKKINQYIKEIDKCMSMLSD